MAVDGFPRAPRFGARYVAALLDLHPRGRAQPTLDGLTAGTPEALFWHRDR
ncbi:hypothetical protein OOZ19_04750 [Saccharopolyspora sp. NFXS83]|nr:hypothetical protein [Saccharopolyspora sp. NFXS83]